MDSKRESARRGTEKQSSSLFGGGVNLGKILGTEIVLDYSLLVIGFLVTFNLGMGLLPAWHPEWSLVLTWTVALAAAVLFIASVLAHELSHAVVGRKVGVPIHKITLFLFGGMAHMDAEPDRPRAEFLTAIVGPLTSIAIGVVATFIGLWLGPNTSGVAEVDISVLQQFGPIATLMLWLGPINILLGVFNLVPGFPLDGGRVLRSILWWATGDFKRATFYASLAGQGIAWLLIGSGVLMMLGYSIPIFGVGFVPGLWSILLGWFLNYAARRSYQQVALSEALDKTPVQRFMLTRLESVPPDITLSEFVFERLLHSDQRFFPVSSDQTFLGLVRLADAQRVAESEWATTPVGDVMVPASELVLLRPEDEASAAMRILTEKGIDPIPVVDQGRLVGLVRREDVLKWVGIRTRS